MSDNGWDQYKKLVLVELERTNSRLLDIDKRLAHIEKKLAVLDAKVYATVLVASVIFTGIFNLVINYI
jgi:hypothetical protein